MSDLTAACPARAQNNAHPRPPPDSQTSTVARHELEQHTAHRGHEHEAVRPGPGATARRIRRSAGSRRLVSRQAALRGAAVARQRRRRQGRMCKRANDTRTLEEVVDRGGGAGEREKREGLTRRPKLVAQPSLLPLLSDAAQITPSSLTQQRSAPPRPPAKKKNSVSQAEEARDARAYSTSLVTPSRASFVCVFLCAMQRAAREWASDGVFGSHTHDARTQPPAAGFSLLSLV